MVDPERPKEPVQVVLARKGFIEEFWDTTRKSGPMATMLLIAVYVLWAQLTERDKQAAETVRQVAVQHAEAVKQITESSARSLREQAQVFQSEQDRTERILGNKVQLNARRVDEVEKRINAAGMP